MSEPNRALSQVPALLEERRKYEGWITALEARRDSTPQHVYERVRDDYRRRLKRVDDQLASFRDALDAERADIEGRLSELRQDEQARIDERAELELRVQVGELSAADAGSAFRTLDDSLRKLSSERETLETKLASLATLLEGHSPPERLAPEPIPAPPPPPPPRENESKAADASFDEMAFLSSVVETNQAAAARPTEPAPPTARVEPPPVEVAPPRDASPAPPPAPAPPAPSPAAEVQTREVQSLAPRDEGGASLLTGVTGKAPTAQHEATASEALLNDLTSGNATHRSETPPLSSKRQAPGATPLSVRPTVTAEQPKTLKCTECGAMNYPTEWYCERCGAELAAL
jgi:hypothetical protein